MVRPRRPGRRSLVLGGGLLLASVLTHSTGSVGFVLPAVGVPPPAGVRDWRDYRQAADAIVWVLTTRLELPVAPFRVEVHPVPASFERALRTHLAMSPELARRTASFAKAAVGGGRVLVNESQMATLDGRERLVTLAHEIAHVCQARLAEGRALVRHQWLVEGFAEWVALQVAGALGTLDFARERGLLLQKVRALHARGGLAPLDRLDTLEQWVRSRQQRGFDAAYPFGFVAVDFLVAQHTSDRLRAYFRAAGGPRDPDRVFSEVFGEPLARFQQALDAHLAAS